MTNLARAVKVGKKFQNPVPTQLGDWKTIFTVLKEHLTSREERTPRVPLGPFHTDPGVYRTAPPSGLRVTWMGHSVSLVEIDSLRILIDPVWDERAAPVQFAGPKRFFPSPLRLEDLPEIDAVLISHDHYDHLGAGTIRRLATMPNLARARWVTALGVGDILSGLGVKGPQIAELDWTESIEVGHLTITSLPTRHFSGRSLLNRFETLWTSYVLAGPQHKIYYGADSGQWPGFAEIGLKYGPFDLTMLEIGAFHPLWADIHLGPEGAIRSFPLLGGAGLLMPIHWGLFDLALHAWRQPIERISSEPGLPLWSPQPGLPTEVVRGVEVRSPWWR